MRVLHATDNFLPTVGGLERAVATLAKREVDSGHTVAVVCAGVHGRPSCEDRDGYRVHRIRFGLQRLPGAYAESDRVFFPPVPDLEFFRSVRRVINSFKPDVIHAHGWMLYSVLGAGRRAGSAMVMNCHDYGQVCAAKTLLFDGKTACSGPGLVKCSRCSYAQYGVKGVPLALGLQVASRRHRKVHSWIGTSEAVTRAGSAPRMSDRRPMKVVPSFVPDEVFAVPSPDRRPAFVPAQGPYVFFAGALGAYKGVDVALRAHQALWAAGQRVPLVLAGSPRGEDLRLDAPGVHVAVDVPHPQVMAGWRHATVGIVPSVWAEPFGQTAVECMAAGTPVVASSTGGLTDIVEHGRSGLLVAPGDVGSLGSALQRLLGDEALCRRLGAEGRVRAQEFSISAVFDRIVAVYREALSLRDAEVRRSSSSDR